MLGKIVVVNVKGMKVNFEGVFYIGRNYGGWKESVLGNPFKIGKDGSRDEVIEKYRKLLWTMYKGCVPVKEEIDGLLELVRNGVDVKLGCWCHPERCHGEMIKRLIEYLDSVVVDE